MVKRATEHGLPVLFDAYSPWDADQPGKFVSLATAVPDARIILAHAHGPGFPQLLVYDIIGRYPGWQRNVWIDISVTGLLFAGSPFAEQLTWVLRRVGTDRVIFGSDYPRRRPADRRPRRRRARLHRRRAGRDPARQRRRPARRQVKAGKELKPESKSVMRNDPVLRVHQACRRPLLVQTSICGRDRGRAARGDAKARRSTAATGPGKSAAARRSPGSARSARRTSSGSATSSRRRARSWPSAPPTWRRRRRSSPPARTASSLSQHFNGYTAYLVQLDEVAADDLREALVDGWLAVAPPQVAKGYLRH